MVSDILENAKEEFKKDQEYWEPIYRAARDDLYFLSAKEDAQWSSTDRKSREKDNRPVLTIDQLGQYVNQVVNDIRKNTPSIDVIPDTDGTPEDAEIQQDLIRDILYNSDADTCFDVAASYAVKGSIGFIRIDTSYINENSFEQQLKIYTVHDPLKCYLDRNSKSITGEDATRATLLSAIDKDTFEKEFLGKGFVSFTDDSYVSSNRDDIILAEVFELDVKKKKIGLTADGTVEEVQEGVEYVQERDAEETTVKRYLMSGEDVLEKSEFVGDFIPLIPVYGNQMWVNGDREISSLIRRSKDAQRMFNYWKSLETELLQKQPKANFMAAVGQVEDFPDQWDDPDKTPVLPYKPTDVAGNPVPPPVRLDPPMIPVGIVNASRAAVDDIKATIGMYAASLGQEANEVSGIAIQRRNEEGDTATYHFSDNLTKSINHVGRLLVGAIPKIYDTPRLISIIDKEGETKVIGVNGMMAKDQDQSYNLITGSYKTKVITGASYTTQRQEAAKMLSDTVAKSPELMPVVGDLLFKSMDFAGADAIAERMKKFIDPKYQDDEEEEFDPEKEQMQTVIQEGQNLIGQLQGEIEDLTDELRDKQGDLVIKAKSEENKKQDNEEKINIDMLKLEHDRENAIRDHQFKMAALELKQRELDIKEDKEQRDIQVQQTNENPQNVELEVNQT